MKKVALIDITSQESEVMGQLMDIIHEHVNDYELTAEEIKALNEAEEVLFRLYCLHRMP